MDIQFTQFRKYNYMPVAILKKMLDDASLASFRICFFFHISPYQNQP